jgi:hypothetical protein
MRIKVITLSLAITDLALFAACGLVLAGKPMKGSPKGEQVAFVIRSGSLCILLLVCLLATWILAWRWMRQLREELLNQTRHNLEELIEGTLQDHERKPS